ncbi:MAG: hypothetical protein H6Q89_812 [Myxococcaceae bacterium]|nr:hypothetical protein [Myxococcaceae bacterium]
MRSLLLVCLTTLIACGTPSKPVDAGTPIDTSCGLDCVAQKSFGLLLNTCFEYADGPTATNPPAVGVFVREIFTLEGGVKTIGVEYSIGGQKKMTDSFGIKDGTLLLMRREFSGGQSVTYKNTANEIVGVGWLDKGANVGSNLQSTSNADVLLGGSNRMSESTTYRVTLAEATTSQITVPARATPWDGGMQMLFSESPDHGSDGLRIWVPEVGFINFSSTFQLAGGSSAQYRLQRIRTIDPTSDAGEKPCSTGTP